MKNISVDWHLTNRCNFYCDYCHPQIRRVLNLKDLNEKSPQIYINFFNSLSPTCHILLSGGEPFMFPMFIELCQGLVEKHDISLNTNFSHSDVYSFLRVIPSSSVRKILAAIHIKERERLGLSLADFIEKYNFAKDYGFNIEAAYVLHPSLLNRASCDIDYMKNKGVDNIVGKVFKGVFDGRRYPDAYSKNEQEIVRRLSGGYKETESYLSGMMTFKDKLCSAGFSSIKINSTGDVQRCASVKESLGNIHEGNVILSSEIYPCTANRILVMSQCKEYLFDGGL